MSNDNLADIELGAIAKDMLICQILTTAFPIFYKKTNLSPKFSFSYDQQGLCFEISFSPRQPSKQEWSLLLEEIFDSEKLITNNHFLNSVSASLNTEQLRFKLSEEMKIIAYKRKNILQQDS